VCIYVCVYVCVYICVCVCMCVRMCIYTVYIHIYIVGVCSMSTVPGFDAVYSGTHILMFQKAL